MLAIKVLGLPSMTADQVRKLGKDIVDAVVSVEEFRLKDETDVVCSFSPDILVEVTGFAQGLQHIDREHIPAVRDVLTTFLKGAVQKRLPGARVKCVV